MNARDLTDTAKLLVAGDKGLLAMDESTPTCDERFAALGIPKTEAARRAYRQLILTTPGLGDHEEEDAPVGHRVAEEPHGEGGDDVARRVKGLIAPLPSVERRMADDPE